MNNSKNEISLYLQHLSLIVLSIFLVSFPLVFSTLSTDAFSLPKQILLGGVAVVLFVALGAEMTSQKRLILRYTPFNLPLFLFVLFVMVSVYFAINRYDSLVAVVPFILAFIVYLGIVNIVKTPAAYFVLLISLVTGAFILSIQAVLAFFNIFILPFEYTHSQTFTPLGSLMDQAIYLAVTLPITIYYSFPLLKSAEMAC